MKNSHSPWLKMNWRRQCRPLTLQELILKSDFYAMMEHITNFSERMIGLDWHFYRSVEYIRTMKVKYDPDYILAKNYDGWPSVCNLEGNSWRILLGHTVQRAKDLHCTDTQLAAQCLWHLTFYGFTPEEQHAHFEHENEEIERQMRNDEMCLCDDIYTDEEIKEFATWSINQVKAESGSLKAVAEFVKEYCKSIVDMFKGIFGYTEHIDDLQAERDQFEVENKKLSKEIEDLRESLKKSATKTSGFDPDAKVKKQ